MLEKLIKNQYWKVQLLDLFETNDIRRQRVKHRSVWYFHFQVSESEASYLPYSNTPPTMKATELSVAHSHRYQRGTSVA